MEDLTALELLILITDIDIVKEDPTAWRWKVIHEYMLKKFRDELMRRDHNEIKAALMDIKRIAPHLTPTVDYVFVMKEVAERFKRQE